MQDSLFTIELPLVKTVEELRRVKIKYPKPKYDPYFIVSACIKAKKEKLEKLWKSFKPYADKKFKTKIIKNFHQRLWEMYIGNVLLIKKFNINHDEGRPDFIVNDNIYIECTAPTKGDPTKSDSVPEMLVAKNIEEIKEQDVPVDQMILRITQVINEKALEQYDKWKRKKWFNRKSSFIIAVNTSDLEFLEDPNMPNVVKALFGFKFIQIDLQTRKTSYSRRNNIRKINNAPVSVNYFVNDDYCFISGVLFSSERVLKSFDNMGDDCIFVNNPFSEYPVDKKFVKIFKHWNAKYDKSRNNLTLQKNY
ncbi:MAG: hypothetical protein US54_C0014G0005 [Candidatus Roizmanbacteria bacterium GW2011_GWA2_37_7]|uniref:Uncharacterized protein n=1 Tax=Candidatus Roizmanbacteria bacterium GW2011_GWA2_37_7 TaxID=1618481 RepID=A0A0G0HI80_9BACT|nr:MAG: hypothetical protein US54_C0014G0005 [Candidatus Roizmanbacteria bacterium GW2011_GWA2_37_7]